MPRRRQRGGNFFSNLGDKIVGALKKPSTYLSAASLIPGVGLVAGAPAAALGALGYGKRKRRRAPIRRKRLVGGAAAEKRYATYIAGKALSRF